MNALLANRFNGRTMAWDKQLDTRIKALTPDQINAGMKKYIDPKQIMIFGPTASLRIHRRSLPRNSTDSITTNPD